MVGNFYYTSADGMQKEYKETIGNVSLDISEGNAQRVQAAQKLDTFARAICNLTTNTFQGSYVEYVYRVDEVLDEG